MPVLNFGPILNIAGMTGYAGLAVREVSTGTYHVAVRMSVRIGGMAS